MKKVSKVVKFTDGHVHEFSYEGQWEQSIKAGEATPCIVLNTKGESK